LFGSLFLSVPLFPLVGRVLPLNGDVARRPTTALLGFWVRDWLMWVIGPLERAFVRSGVSPDVFNLLGVFFGGAAGVAYATGGGRLSLAGWLILPGGACDVFDGRIARARGMASNRGAFLDSTLDRFSETFAFMGLAFRFAGDPGAVVAVALALGGSLLVSYTRARGEALGVSCRGGIMQRAERLVLLALASLLDAAVTARSGWAAGTVLYWTVIAIGAGSLGTAVYRTLYIARELGRR
ncbi:MAG: CDP-alcohol phosphatidyltransferase family protein, partial [Gemmatimonadaceae bacterium]